MNDTDKNKLDISQIFLVFMATVGDADKTAHALNLEPDVVEALAKQEGWLDKIRRISIMSKSEKPGDYERAANRAMNYVQAHMFRQSMEKVLKAVRALDSSETLDTVTTIGKDQKPRLSGRFFSDMASAMEKVHAMTYASLGDSSVERKEMKAGVQGSTQPADIHAAVIAALNADQGEVPTTQALLEAAQQEVVDEVVEQAKPA